MITDPPSAGASCDPVTRTCERLFCRKMPNESLYKCTLHTYPLGKKTEGVKFGKFNVERGEETLQIKPGKDVTVVGWTPTKDCFGRAPLPTIPTALPRRGVPPRGTPPPRKAVKFTKSLLVGFCWSTLGRIQREMEAVGPSIMKALDEICDTEMSAVVGEKDPTKIAAAKATAERKMRERALELKEGAPPSLVA